jgi:FRG domain
MSGILGHIIVNAIVGPFILLRMRDVHGRSQRLSKGRRVRALALTTWTVKGGRRKATIWSALNVWLYRGLADDTYKLIPSAFRRAKPSHREQILYEKELLFEFFSLCDSTGLQLPEDSQELRTVIKWEVQKSRTGQDDSPNSWPPRELWSLLGLAQHYGVPTRLLDWSRQPYQAAYFAVSGAMKKIRDPKISAGDRSRGSLSVWIFDYSALVSHLDKSLADLFKKPNPQDLPVELITASHAQNPNLHAQDGVFTMQLIREDIDSQIDPDEYQLDKTVAKLTTNRSEDKKPIFYRIRLPWSESEVLRWLLEKEGVSAATIFPGYKGVVQAMDERRRAEGRSLFE